MPHTPGPWSADETRHNYDRVIRNAERDPVALVFIAGYGPETGKSNALLIAAAPDLLYALRDLVAIYAGIDDMLGPTVKTKLASARAAIAKAENR